jgi:hypothetical protein
MDTYNPTLTHFWYNTKYGGKFFFEQDFNELKEDDVDSDLGLHFETLKALRIRVETDGRYKNWVEYIKKVLSGDGTSPIPLERGGD